MSQLEQQLRAALLVNAGVVAALGQRIYAVQIPQNYNFQTAGPCAAMQRISTTRQYSNNAPGGNQGTFMWARIQFTVFAGGATGANDSLEASSAIVAACQTFNLGVLGSSPTVLAGAPNFVINERMEVEPQPTNQPLYKTILDLKIAFQNLN